MKIIYNKNTFEHNSSSDFEGAYRLKGIEKIGNDHPNIDYEEAEKWIVLTHSKRHLSKVKGACKLKQLLAEVKTDMKTYDAALISVYLSLEAARKGLFAAIRPPGHHAEKEKPMGFCYFNNIACATSMLLSEGKKVCIIDIDGHHGNGTEKIFYKNPNVLYISIHEASSYPYSGLTTRTGEKDGKGLNINMPIVAGSGDKEILERLTSVKDRILDFSPDNIGVSAGFDCYYKDKLLNLEMTLDGYGDIGKYIKSLDKPTFAILEGGYHEDVVKCINSFCKKL